MLTHSPAARAPDARPLRLFIDLAGYDAAHVTVWRNRLAELAPAAAPDVTLADKSEDADYIVETIGRQSFIGGKVFTVAPDSHYHTRPESTFVWDSGDHPTGRLPGLYCSLDRSLFDRQRHRGFCYPLRYNPHLAPFPLEDARHLFGFCGNASSGLRHRLFAEFAAYGRDGVAVLRNTASLWGELFAGKQADAWKSYAEALRRCRFFLCPRGNGLSSIRLFETMEAARVPVILSDRLVLPQCVDWRRCAIVFPERELSRLPAYLESRANDWPDMARRARAEWEANFSPAQLLRRVGSELTAIVAERSRPEQRAGARSVSRIAPQFAWRGLKSVVRRSQQALKKARHRA